jgi:hypothetical protein
MFISQIIPIPKKFKYFLKITFRTQYWLFVFLFYFLPSELFASKTDIVTLLNGDKITCEIKELKAGKLRVKTDDMGTVYIEWDKIAGVRARQKFEVELQFGSIYYGSLGLAEDPRKMTVTGDSLKFELFRAFVVNLTPIKDTFLDRLDGSINLGVDYTKASEVLQLNFSGDAKHRSREGETVLSFSSVITGQRDKETSQRNNLSINNLRFLKNRWAWGLLSSLEQNTELGIDLRFSLGGGFGRRVIQSNQMNLSLTAGLSTTREWINKSENQNNLELPLSAKFAMFVYDNPKTDINTTVTLHPSLSTIGRTRLEIDSKIKRELFTDFHITFNLYLSYDNKPPYSDAKNVDYGFVLSFGYIF